MIYIAHPYWQVGCRIVIQILGSRIRAGQGRAGHTTGERTMKWQRTANTWAASQFQERKERTCKTINIYFQLQEPSSIC